MVLLKTKRVFQVITVLFLFFSSFQLFAQSSSKIYHDLLRLQETKRVLYIAAHPDDENTRLITYLGNHEHAQVAYLSLTRGDGGQNLIGKELGLELGMIRTQELLKARETDGGTQFFSRAIDFGYSRNPQETLNNWDKEKLLSDVVWIIRSFQPDLIINRFNTVPGTTHGHHTTSAILSVEAFQEAAKAASFSDQLILTEPWQAKRVFWNGYNWGVPYEPGPGKVYHAFQVGGFNPLLGTTYSQIAADSRTMHKSQGFGATAQIGESQDFIELIDGEPFGEDPFEGVGNRWKSLKNGAQIEAAIANAIDRFDFLEPSRSVSQLVQIKKLLDAVALDQPWIREKQAQIDQIIVDALGMDMEFNADRELAHPSEDIHTSLVINSPSTKEVQVLSFTVLDNEESVGQVVKDNKAFTRAIPLVLPANYPLSQPYWLEQPPENSLFTIPDQKDRGRAFNDPAVYGSVRLLVDGVEIIREIPLKFKYNDPVDGEVNQPFTVIPEIRVSVKKENVFVLNGQPEVVEVEVSFEDEIKDGILEFEGFTSGNYQEVNKMVDTVRNKVYYQIRVNAATTPGKEEVTVKFQTADGKVFDQGMKRISYKHIPNLSYFPTSSFNLINLSLNISQQRIGYIPGAGDDIPEVLNSLGYDVTLLENGSLTADRLGQFNTVIVGIRAYNTNQHLANYHAELMKYVESGGNLIVQYNTTGPLLVRNLGPYPFQLSRDRVTVEDSPVRLKNERHHILTSPNRIDLVDFDGWIQERGLYFPGSWDDRYATPIIMQDPGEKETQGGLLLADYGKGTYTYSGISWFRLLPAGVPGAIKLFVNLIEQAND